MFMATLFIKCRNNSNVHQLIKWIKQTVIYVFFSHKTQTRHCYDMDKAFTHYAKWKKPDTEGHILYDSVYIICLK